MTNAITPQTPTAPSERIVAMDALRGFAVLGILIMNIQSYSMIEAAYINPTAYGDLTGINRWISVLSHLFAEGKFMAIFSMLFGAGVVLMTSKAEAKGRSAVGLHYRRTFWLIVIGMMHAYLLWYGDILTAYGVCALLVFLFRKVPARWLLVLGLISVSVSSFIYLSFGFSLPYWPAESYQEVLQAWKPAGETIGQEISSYQGSWQQQMAHRAPAALMFQTFLFVIWVGWRAGGLMLVGMALFKWGLFSAERSKRFYSSLAGIGFGLGLPVVVYGIALNYQAKWSFDYSMFIGNQFNYWGSILIALGYIGVIMLICKSIHLSKLTGRFAAVGRMALSNYLMQTIICTIIFYGHGLGLFGRIERSGQILIVFGIWVFQLWLSPVWLRYFRFGPAEWIWRSLTYWRLQPVRQED